MSSYPTLYVLRHGQTEWNAERRMQGHLDSPLTAVGIAQARDQRRVLERLELTGFVAISSPQGRAVETARIALTGLVPDIRTDTRLREIGVGGWAGRTAADLMLEGAVFGDDAGSLLHYDRAPDGEGFEALFHRCRGFLDALDGPAVLVTHGVTSRMLRLIVQGLGIAEIDDVPGGQGVVYRLENGRQTLLENGS